MCPAHAAATDLRKECCTLRSLHPAWQAEVTHVAFYREAKAAVGEGADYGAEWVFVCSECGHTAASDTPDTWPVCGAKREKNAKSV